MEIRTVLHDTRAIALTVSMSIIFALGAFGVANAQTVTVSVTLDPGDSGSQVTALQAFLAADTTLYPEGLVTGYYGPLTEAAVKRFQCRYDIVCSGSPTATGYGRVGPQTLLKIQSISGGISLPPSGNPSGGSSDVWAPIIDNKAIATTSTSATIHWTTNEPARNRVMYGVVWPFLLASAPSIADATFDTSGDVVLTGLSPNTRYYYVPESVDASGNLQ